MREWFYKLMHSIEMFKLERKARKEYDKIINELLEESRRRYSRNLSSELLYIKEALSKAALKVVDEEEFEENDGPYKGMAIVTKLNGGCPTCHATIYKSQNYCSNCGQRITFSRRQIC